MRTLGDLLGSAEGRRLVEEKGVSLEPEAFVDRLAPPRHGDLMELVGVTPPMLPIYVGHQLLADYAAPVISKLRAAVALQAVYPGPAAAFVWLDLHRAGSDRTTAGIRLEGRSGAVGVRLAPRRHDQKETRFIPVDRDDLRDAFRRVGVWARQEHRGVAERWQALEAAVLADEPSSLVEANLAVTSFLVREHLGARAPSVLVSDLVDRHTVRATVDETVDRIDDVITVFNAAVESLIAADIHPQVRPLPADYLPLHYSCELDDRRCRLMHERRGADHFAVTTCSCGTTYRFHLGNRALSIDELASTGRWSTDVTLPLYLAELASGVVVGRSSGLYGIVLNEVAVKVLGRAAIPAFIPVDLSAHLAAAEGGVAATSPPESLLAGYLLGG